MGPAEMSTANFDGVTLEYEVRGAGEPLALIHLAPYAQSFLPLMDQPALAAYRRVRYHRRGYCGSSRSTSRITMSDQAADLAHLLEHLDVSCAHVAGHSYGGLIALQLALDRPDLVASLVLMEPALRVRSGGPASQDLTHLMAPAFQLYRAGDTEAAVDAFLSATFAPGFRDHLDQILPGGWSQAVRDAETFFGTENPELQHWEFGEAEARRIPVPVVSIGGELSHPAFTEIQELLRAWFPQLETVRIEGVDHMLHLKQPGLVATALAEFLASHQIWAEPARP